MEYARGQVLVEDIHHVDIWEIPDCSLPQPREVSRTHSRSCRVT